MTDHLLRSERGFTLVEMLVATAIMVGVTAAIFGLLDPSRGTYRTQPEVSEMQQRLRVGTTFLANDLLMAGAGTYTGASAGALYNYFAPVLPYRKGDIDPDPPGTFRSDAISIVYVPQTPSQTTIRDEMPRTASQLKVNPQPNCPPSKHDALCGFKQGMRVMLFDSSGAWDSITITTVQDEALHLGYDGQLSVAYGAGSYITQVATHTYYLNADPGNGIFQLMHYDGYQTDIPVVDNVVDLQFEYFGDPQPPRLIDGKALTDPIGPWTTYGPKPPPLGVDRASDSWGAGENCVFMVSGGQHVPRLPVLAEGSELVRLDANRLTDGPWCPDDANGDRYDADLLRVRKIGVRLRVQVASAELRGPAGVLFRNAGTSAGGNRIVPDQEIRFDISPRNLNLGR
jgi:prepilin-type N-terminal cleavage/methylation domain-containing protein